MLKYHRILSKIVNQPLLVEPTTLSVFLSVLGDRAGVGEIHLQDGSVLDTDAMRAVVNVAQGRDRRPYQVDGGVAIIPVSGTLANKTGSIQPYSGVTGYDGIEAQMWMALEDSAVDSILLDIDSGGGSVAGLFDLTDMIHDANSIKPVTAFAGEMAASAAYAIASAAKEVYLPRTGRVGSIGVLTVHQSIEGALDKAGVKMTIIHAGANKVDGNPYEDLPDDVREKIQGEIDQARELFAGSVARYRGVTVASVLDTEAAMFTGQTAVDAGLADGIMSFNQVLNMLKKKSGTSATVVADAVDLDVVADIAADALTSDAELATVAAETTIEGIDVEIDAEIPNGGGVEADYTHIHAMSAVDVIDACTKAGHVGLAANMITQRYTASEVDQRLQDASDINDLCVAAGVDSAQIIASLGNPVDIVRVMLVPGDEAEINSIHMNDDLAEPQSGMSSSEIWKRRNDETNQSNQ